MKRIIVLLSVFLGTVVYAQSPTYVDLDFIKSSPETMQDYDNILKDKWAKLAQQRIDSGYIIGWDVWKVVGGATKDAHHSYVIATVYSDISKRLKGAGIKRVFPEMTEMDVEIFGKKNSRSRTIISTATNVSLGGYLKNDTIPNIAVLNFMKVPFGKASAYERMELSWFKKAHQDNPKSAGWFLHKRIDRYGEDLYWNYMTVDLYDNYRDYLEGNVPTPVANKQFKEINKLRTHKVNDVMWKFISLR